ncbi:MAG: 3-hydroxyacyl-CoA dehydrogenase family protein, partial [Spirochaetes bacterium]|nr:3-hydroxyacyl-CoA dehydrogenase family protein [Spirochaetota bacterium]
ISEDIDKKKKLFSMLDNIVDDSCIFTTNTSSLKPDELAPSQKRSSNFAGLHFFYPVKMKSMLELNKSSKTDDLTIKKINNFAKKINKKIIILEDDNCFLLNKIFLDFQSEAFNLKDEFNLNFLQIDHIIRKSIFPIGVFEFFDSVGIDVMYSAIKNYIKDYNNREYYINMVNMLKSMINNNELGKKTKKGFYDYKESAKNDEHFVSENIEKIINKRLISVFLKSFSKFQKSSKIKSEILNECIKDYMSCDYGPLEMIMQDKIIYQ